MNASLSLFLIALAVAIGVLSAVLRGFDARRWALGVLTAALAVGSLLAGHGWTSVILLNAAELAAVVLVWSFGTPAAAKAARAYLTAVVPAIALTVIALALVGLGEHRPDGLLEKLAVGLTVIGFALKLGLFPVYFWLPAVAAATPALTVALIVAVVDVAVFAELYVLRAAAPWMFVDYVGIWIAIAVLSLLGGALLALAQRELRTMLAFSSIEDMGYLLIGVVAGGAVGAEGAWLGILSHALCKAALFGAVGLAEARIGTPVTLDTRGLAGRVPVAGATFLIGALAFVGVPPALGFAGHWRLYLAGAELGGPLLIGIMFVASALALLCYARAIHRTWLGTPDEGMAKSGATPRIAAAVLVALVVAIVGFGLHPAPLMTATQAPAPVAALDGRTAR